MATALNAGGTVRLGTDTLGTFDRISDLLSTWHQRALTRRELARLDDRMLHDIGLSTADVEREINKPFWRA